jgi:hypothetical protein
LSFKKVKARSLEIASIAHYLGWQCTKNVIFRDFEFHWSLAYSEILIVTMPQLTQVQLAKSVKFQASRATTFGK